MLLTDPGPTRLQARARDAARGAVRRGPKSGAGVRPEEETSYRAVGTRSPRSAGESAARARARSDQRAVRAARAAQRRPSSPHRPAPGHKIEPPTRWPRTRRRRTPRSNAAKASTPRAGNADAKSQFRGGTRSRRRASRVEQKTPPGGADGPRRTGAQRRSGGERAHHAHGGGQVWTTAQSVG